MKVTVSVFGRFHAFNLAEQLFKQDALNKLITSYPAFEVVKYGIPGDKVTSLPVCELINRGWNKVQPIMKNCCNAEYLIAEFYDRLASMRFDQVDIVTGWTFSFLHTLRKAKSMGAITIVERGSSHILSQMNILKEEYNTYGIKPRLAHPKLIEKELLEYKEADYISIPSSFVKRTFLDKNFPKEKLIHVPYGVNLDDFSQIPKEDNIFRIIHCGGINIRKGVHYLLQAFYELRLPDAELWIIGSMNKEMLPIFKKYDNGKVFHKGPYRQNKLYKYYSQGSVFVIMSIEEGLAMVQPQAMACGLPVICTTNSGGEDIIRHGKDGFIIPIRDVEALKDKILYLYKNPEICKAMGQSAKQRVSNGFTWEDYGTKMIEAYKQCLQNKTSTNNAQHNS